MAIDELNELLDTAVYKEIASEAFYLASEKRTEDAGAREMMKRLAVEERGHTGPAEEAQGTRPAGAAPAPPGRP